MNHFINSILISVIIPTYNRTESLYRLLDCLQKQTIINSLEIIIVDQNKSGYLKKEIFNLCKILILKSPNVSAARNIGALNSSGDWLLFMDDDLLPEHNYCEKAFNYLILNNHIDCLCPLIYNNYGKKYWHTSIMKNMKNTINSNLYEVKDVMSASFFIQRKTYIDSGGFDEFIFDFCKTGEDQEYFLRIRKRFIKIYYTPLLTIFHDDIQLGGCQLRIDEYWSVRKRCIKSWVFRYKIHSGCDLKLRLIDFWNLSRSTFLNFNLIKKSPFSTFKQIILLIQAIKESKSFLVKLKKYYTGIHNIDHLEKYIKNL